MLPLGGTTETKTRILLEEVQRQDLSSKEWLFAYEQARKLQQEVAMLRGHRAAQAELLDLFEHLWTYVDIPFDKMRFNDDPYIFLLSKNPMCLLWLETNEDFQKKVYRGLCVQAKTSLPIIFAHLDPPLSLRDSEPKFEKLISSSPWYEIMGSPNTEVEWGDAIPRRLWPINDENNKISIRNWVSDLEISVEFFTTNHQQRCLLMHRFIREFCLHFGAPVPITPLSFLEEVNDETI